MSRRLVPLRAMLLLPLLSVGLAAQTPISPLPTPPEEKPQSKRSEEMKAFVDQAFSVPPEFAADVLLKLAASSLIAEKKWKLELIEEAFRTASGAPSPPYRRVAPRLSVDTLINRQNDGNNLDLLALRLRAVELMLDLDVPRARSMFEEIGFPKLVKETCDNPLTPQVFMYYDTAGKVFARAFSAIDRRKRQDLLFSEQLIAPLDSHAQVGPVLTMILKANVSAQDRQRLLAQFAGRLEHASGGDRVFGTGTIFLEPVPERASAATFVPALRQYLVRHTGGPRCSDNLPKSGVLPDPVKRFNELIAKVDPAGTQFDPITVKESTPLVDEGTYPRQLHAQSAYGVKMLAAVRSLKVPNPNGQTLDIAPLEQRQTVEWKVRFQETLRLADEWPETAERSREEYLIEVAIALGSLADMAPTPEVRDYVMDRYLIFLESRYAETDNRNLWYSLVRGRLWRGEDAERQASWLIRLVRSSNPIIALYARFELMMAASRKNSVGPAGVPKCPPVSGG